MRRLPVAWTVLAILMLTGCATGRTGGGVTLDWKTCGAAGALAGGAIGATDSAGAALGGALIGGLIGAVSCRGATAPVDSDADGDGVRDTDDRCPATAADARVDAAGCEPDGDADGVVDRLDLCPRSAAHAKVNAAGCEVIVDSDRDGVADARDECPYSTPKARTDARGCEADGDADGVPDASDRCPGTPAERYVDRRGCEPDGDADGVADDFDLCRDTAAGAKVDAQGCPAPLADADAESVADAVDACPASAAGAELDDRGCPPPRTRVLGGVLFGSGSARLGAGARQALDEVAAVLRSDPALTLRIGGHTDSTGSAAGNRRLSQQRAQAARRYLIERGIAPDRLSAFGHGPDQPVADNTTPAGRSANRRVELEFR